MFCATLVVALACVCWGVDNHLTALIDGLTPAESTFWKGLVAGSVNLLLGVVAQPLTASLSGVLGALGLGAVAYGVSIVLYIQAAQRLGATRAQLFFATAPFFGGAGSLLLLGERLTPAQGVAALILTASLVLLLRERHAHPHEQITNVLEGQFELTIAGEVHTAGPGTAIIIPGGVRHSGKALSDCRLLDVFYPVREEYRTGK